MGTNGSSGFVRHGLVIAALLTLHSSGHDGALGSSSSAVEPGRLSPPDAAVPMAFEKNLGQTDPSVAFLSRGRGYGVFLSSTGAAIRLVSRPGDSAASHALIRMTLVGASPARDMKELEPLAGKVNYFVGTDPRKWYTDIATFAKVRFTEVYPGVDVVYHGTQSQLEYDFIVAPGSDPRRVRLRFDGETRIDRDGTLVVRFRGREVRQKSPVIYQEADGKRWAVRGGYTRKRNGEIGFHVDSYDLQKELIIDPVIVYATYLGGATAPGGPAPLAPDSIGRGIAVGSDRSIYVTGTTSTLDFPTHNPLQPLNAGNADVFVTKISADGSTLLFSTFFGGDADDAPITLALDGADNVYVHGGTVSEDFPTTPGAFRRSGRGFFVFKLNARGDTLIYSTLAFGEAAAVDATGNVYLIGETNAEGFTFSKAFQPTLAGGFDAIVGKLSPDGSQLAYLTYLGGTGGDAGRGIAVDHAGYLYAVGFTTSVDFPTRNPIQPALAGGFPYGDCWVAKMTQDGSALVYSTYLGGSDNDVCMTIAVDPGAHAHVGGETWSPDFPVVHPLQPFRGGPRDAVAAKLDAAGSSLIYSTYLGGDGDEFGAVVAADLHGASYVTGTTASTNFPTFRPLPLQTPTPAALNGFVVKLSAPGAPLYSTYVDGGSIGLLSTAIRVDADGTAYLTGATGSADFPTKNALQPALAGTLDAIIVKIADPPCPEDVTNRVAVLRFPQQGIPFGPFRFQWVIVFNPTGTPIPGPLAYVMDDLQNGVSISTLLKTQCLSPAADPFTVVPVGSDNLLRPNESVLTGLWFLQTQSGALTYTPRVLSGIPLR